MGGKERGMMMLGSPLWRILLGMMWGGPPMGDSPRDDAGGSPMGIPLGWGLGGGGGRAQSYFFTQ